MKDYYNQPVEKVSLETYEDDGELFGDDGLQMEEAYSKSQQEYILNGLTKRQREVAELLLSGYKRKEIAETKGVTLQAIHQIIPRIRLRMRIMQNVNAPKERRLHDIA